MTSGGLSYGDKGVAPFAGAWIEIWCICDGKDREDVAPFAGAWIEIRQR